MAVRSGRSVVTVTDAGREDDVAIAPEIPERPPGTPKYQWLRELLLDHIDTRLAIGDALPSERELADLTGTSRMTARRVLSELMADGRVHRSVGRGTFVSAPTIRIPIRLTSFSHDMTTRGYTPGARTIDFATGPVEAPAADELDVAPGSQAHVITRLRTADGVPMAIERVTLAAELLPGLSRESLEDRSLYALLAERAGVVFDGGMEAVRARNASAWEARLLDIPAGDAVLHLTRTSSWRGRVLEYTVSFYRGDRYELSSRL